jgi:chitin disaccharide deacetylase
MGDVILMTPNPALRKLGFADHDRVVIIHADDIGMSQSNVAAYADLVEAKVMSSAAVMVPCGWFPAVARYCREHPNVDMGVHLTLNSETDACRWRPLSTHDPASGLVDEEGYFHRTREAFWEAGDPDSVLIELQAQVERALASGIDVTHIDTHMGAVVHPKFVPAYVQTALQFQLPMMCVRWNEAQMIQAGVDAATAGMVAQMVTVLEGKGMPLLDHMVMLPLDMDSDLPRLERAKRAFAALPPGITHFILHPFKDTPETRGLTPNWRPRVGDYEILVSEELDAFLDAQGIHRIGYRALRDVMRGG